MSESKKQDVYLQGVGMVRAQDVKKNHVGFSVVRQDKRRPQTNVVIGNRVSKYISIS